MTDILRTAQKRLWQISEESESIHDIIVSGEHFLSRIRHYGRSLSDDVLEINTFVSKIETVLERARSKLHACLEEARVLGEFIEYGKSLEDDLLEDDRETVAKTVTDRRVDRVPETTPQAASAPAQVARTPLRPRRLQRARSWTQDPLFDWVALFAWIAVLGIVLYY